MKNFLMGNEILAKAAIDGGAKIMFGYPITPTTEVLESWIKIADINPQLKYLQTEDEGAAGFGVGGSTLAGIPAFTVTAGPGNILMQDPISMAEATRLPFVAYIGQRGGPSTGTVIYSQQELFLTLFGGNGEGFRIVYSPAGLQDLYNYGKKVFQIAWKYRFPTFLLYDGYQGKMKGEVYIDEKNLPLNNRQLLRCNITNTYNQEEELFQKIIADKKDFDLVGKEISEYEFTGSCDNQVCVLAHGIVSAAAKISIKNLIKQKMNIGLFRPITLSPFPREALLQSLKRTKKIIIFESSLGQFTRIIKDHLYNQINIPIVSITKPALGFVPEEIEDLIKSNLK